MPELPEVETVRRTLLPRILGQTVNGVWCSRKKLRGHAVDKAALQDALVGQAIQAVDRKGKYLLLRTTRGGVMVHLGMSGRLLICPGEDPLAPHTHVILFFDNKINDLRYVDPRRFGVVMPFLGEDPQAWQALGTDPLLDPSFGSRLRMALAGTRRAIREVLLDQNRVTGLGNIYVAEVLFAAGIHPGAPASRLSRGETDRLERATRRVLQNAVARRGTSLNDYVDATGLPGTNQRHLKVYGRAGLPCVRCGTRIRGVAAGGRTSFYCPGCQPRAPA